MQTPIESTLHQRALEACQGPGALLILDGCTPELGDAKKTHSGLVRDVTLRSHTGQFSCPLPPKHTLITHTRKGTHRNPARERVQNRTVLKCPCHLETLDPEGSSCFHVTYLCPQTELEDFHRDHKITCITQQGKLYCTQ